MCVRGCISIIFSALQVVYLILGFSTKFCLILYFFCLKNLLKKKKRYMFERQGDKKRRREKEKPQKPLPSADSLQITRLGQEFETQSWSPMYLGHVLLLCQVR